MFRVPCNNGKLYKNSHSSQAFSTNFPKFRFGFWLGQPKSFTERDGSPAMPRLLPPGNLASMPYYWIIKGPSLVDFHPLNCFRMVVNSPKKSPWTFLRVSSKMQKINFGTFKIRFTPTLKTNSKFTPENRSNPKRKPDRLPVPSIFRSKLAISFREGNFVGNFPCWSITRKVPNKLDLLPFLLDLLSC